MLSLYFLLYFLQRVKWLWVMSKNPRQWTLWHSYLSITWATSDHGGPKQIPAPAGLLYAQPATRLLQVLPQAGVSWVLKRPRMQGPGLRTHYSPALGSVGVSPSSESSCSCMAGLSPRSICDMRSGLEIA
jgi:hypothetical protein